MQKSPSKSSIEKRGGILKPQGSLEKAREEREQALVLSTNIPSVIEVNETPSRSISTDVVSTIKLKRNRQNVAMQALAKKVEESSKQVTFVTEPAIKNKVIEQQKPQAINPFQNQMQQPPQPQQQQQQQLQQPPPPPPMSFKQNVPFPNTFPMPPSSFQNQHAYHSRPYQNFDVQQNYQTQSDQPFKNNWLHDDKLPMPPSTWTSWPHNPKNIQQRPFPPPPPLNNEHFRQNFSFNTPNTNFQDNITPNYDNNLTPNTNNPMYNNTMSLWNSGPNFQPNLQMIFNQQSKQNTTNPAQPLFNEPVMVIIKIYWVYRKFKVNTLQPDRNQSTNSPVSSGGYSLFNSNWAPNLTVHSSLKYNNQSAPDRGGPAPPLMRQQSLFSGPGPSPLERLLQQQKQQRDGPNSTHKEDT